jgi:hypothetical protein
MRRLPRTESGQHIQRLPQAGDTATASLVPLPRTDSQLAGTQTTDSSVSLNPPLNGSRPGDTVDTTRATSPTATFSWEELAGETIFQQGKTFLAILGFFTLLAHFSRLFLPRTD